MVAASVAIVQAQQKGEAPKKEADRGKKVIEFPAESVLAKSADAKAPARDFVNPKVAPGKVTWHPDLTAACTAAKTGSGTDGTCTPVPAGRYSCAR